VRTSRGTSECCHIFYRNKRTAKVASSKSIQQFNMLSSYQRQGPFQICRGSTARAFNEMTSVECRILFHEVEIGFKTAIPHSGSEILPACWSTEFTFSSRHVIPVLFMTRLTQSRVDPRTNADILAPCLASHLSLLSPLTLIPS
jgi:hypothetical protein